MPALEYHINVDQASGNPVELLTLASGLTRQRIKQVMHKVAVWLERQGGVRRIRRAKSRLQAGDRLHLYYNEQVLATEPMDARLDQATDGLMVLAHKKRTAGELALMFQARRIKKTLPGLDCWAGVL